MIYYLLQTNLHFTTNTRGNTRSYDLLPNKIQLQDKCERDTPKKPQNPAIPGTVIEITPTRLFGRFQQVLGQIFSFREHHHLDDVGQANFVTQFPTLGFNNCVKNTCTPCVIKTVFSLES